MIFGVDEVGLGALAGPLVVCAFAAPGEDWSWRSDGILPKKYELNDSKKLTRKAREWLSAELAKDFPDQYVILEVPSEEIDTSGIAACLSWALNAAVKSLLETVGIPERVIIDGEDKGVPGAEFYPKADGKFPCVMAASILAKNYRDTLMSSYAEKYAGYSFGSNSGYGTKAHTDALERLGPCNIHRKTFAPVSYYFRKEHENRVAT